jgi:hypothetical protein
VNKEGGKKEKERQKKQEIRKLESRYGERKR